MHKNWQWAHRSFRSDEPDPDATEATCSGDPRCLDDRHGIGSRLRCFDSLAGRRQSDGWFSGSASESASVNSIAGLSRFYVLPSGRRERSL